MTGRIPDPLPLVPELTAEYLLIGEIGRGGSAVVYLARDRELEREVAIKLVRAPLAGDDESRARFGREARTAALLHHPNIVGVHAVKRLADGGLALVMQYVPGRTLKQILRRTGPLEFDQIERVLRDISAALSYAHDRGVVHRDVKPENIFIHEEEGRALLADFGIARTAESHAGLTLDGMAIGTPAYMAPEHIDGGSIDHRADLYSLGMVTWEMITGEAPWEGESLYSIIYKQKHTQLSSLTDYRTNVPFHLWYVVERLTRKDRARRFGDARELLEALSDARVAGPWRRWWMKRGMQLAQPTTSPPPLAVPPGLPGDRGGLLHTGSGESTADGATVRYRRPEGGGTESEEVTSGISSGPEPAVQTQSLEETDTAGTSTASDAWAAFTRADFEPEQPPRLVLRRLPFAALLVVLALLTGVGATLFALGSPSTASEPAASVLNRSQPDASGTPMVPTTHPAPLGDGPALHVPSEPAEEPLEADEAESLLEVALGTDEPNEPEQPDADLEGDAEVEETTLTPIQTPPVQRFASRPTVSAGGLHTCTVGTDGTAYCWGGNTGGQVGNGRTVRSPTPTPLSVNETFRQIAAGFSHTCGITTTGRLLCWGANDSGQLGMGAGGAQSTPAIVSSQREFETVAVGRSHSCALGARGDAYCWGANGSGQLGDRSRTSRSTPTSVAAESGLTAISAGWNHTCALTFRGSALCWGQNAEGQLGNDATTDHVVPTAVLGRRTFSRISAGGAHTCALASNGAAYCWGHNAHGQLGDGSTIGRTVPVPVVASAGFVEITAGGVHTCALTQEGEAYCWGRNVYGQLGDGTTVDRLSPMRVDTGQRFVSLHASGSHTCGTTRGGDRLCWGYNLEGQLGDGSRTHQPRPVSVPTPQA
jgi:serine/threonine protein kinase/alpha-tubulin suppressor-like RCC1 family protein